MAAPVLKLVDPAASVAERSADRDLLRLIDEEIASGITFENDDKVGHESIKTRKGARDAMLDYYDGVMDDLPAETGRSSVVSRDVADVTDTILPGLMRVFAGGERVVVYKPAKPGDEEAAAQATDYVNHVWQNECDGYRITQTAIKDALDVRNGIVKVYWDPTPDYETEDLRGLDEGQLVELLSNPDEVELVGADERQETLRDPSTGQSIPLTVYDVRVKRVATNGRLVVENVPPDDFGVSRGTRSIPTARASWHKSRVTRSDLVEQGYNRGVVEKLPAYSAPARSSEADRHDEDDKMGSTAGETGATAEIEIIEAYVRFDMDDDGVAEMRKVVVAGASGGREILSNEPWPDDAPFVDIVAQPVPHRWMARSVGDNCMDLQRVKTALMRGVMDNTYAQNMPDRVVNEKALVNADEVKVRAFGNIIRVKGDMPPAAAVMDLTTPNVAGNTLQAIAYVDSVIQRRTGVSAATASLDSTALDPQTATAATIEHDASYARVELIARNMAELGFKPLFAKILRILVRNQDRPRTILLRDKWVNFDPSGWNAAMNASINVGLGTGSRERDLAMLAGVRGRQNAIIEQLGIDNPVVKPSMVISAEQKMTEAAGLRDPEQYFATVSDEDFKAWQESKPPAPPDPKIQAMEAKTALEQAKLQADIAGDQQRAEVDVGMAREKLAAELEMKREQLAQEHALKIEELNRTFALREQEYQLEAELKAGQIMAGAQSAVSANIPRY